MTASGARETFPLPQSDGRPASALALRWDSSTSNSQGDNR